MTDQIPAEASEDEWEALMEAVKEAEDYMTDGGYSDLVSIVETILAAGFRRRPVPSRDEIADEVSGIQVGSGYYATAIGRDAALEAADAVLALFKGGEG